MQTPWHQTAPTRRLLARIVTTQPTGRFHRTYYVQTVDEAFRYEGPLVHRLHALKTAREQRVLDACHKTGDYEPFAAVAAELSVDDAIDAALARVEVAGRAAA